MTICDKRINYPQSAACGQLGQNYYDYDCPDACPGDSYAGALKAGLTQAHFVHAPGPMGGSQGMVPGAYNFPPQDMWDKLAKNACSNSVQIMGFSTDATLGWKWLDALPKTVCVAKKDIAAQRGTNCEKHMYSPNMCVSTAGKTGEDDKCSAKTEEECKDPCKWNSRPEPSPDCLEDTDCTTKPLTPITTPDNKCVWWGRGVIQTSGRCNYGKLSKALAGHTVDSHVYGGVCVSTDGTTEAECNSKKTAEECTDKCKWNELDPYFLCKDPYQICSTDESSKILRWLAGLFFWVTGVQEFYLVDPKFPLWKEPGHYKVMLTAAAQDKLPGKGDVLTQAQQDFIDATSGIVNRGCPDTATCTHGAVDGAEERSDNFLHYLQAFQALGTSDVTQSLDASIAKIWEDRIDQSLTDPTEAQQAKNTYKLDDFKKALTFATTTGFNSTKLLAPTGKEGFLAVAAFLAQSTKEALQYGACDENNWSSDASRMWTTGTCVDKQLYCDSLRRSNPDTVCFVDYGGGLFKEGGKANTPTSDKTIKDCLAKTNISNPGAAATPIWCGADDETEQKAAAASIASSGKCAKDINCDKIKSCLSDTKKAWLTRVAGLRAPVAQGWTA